MDVAPVIIRMRLIGRSCFENSKKNEKNVQNQTFIRKSTAAMFLGRSQL